MLYFRDFDMNIEALPSANRRFEVSANGSSEYLPRCILGRTCSVAALQQPFVPKGFSAEQVVWDYAAFFDTCALTQKHKSVGEMRDDLNILCRTRPLIYDYDAQARRATSQVAEACNEWSCVSYAIKYASNSSLYLSMFSAGIPKFTRVSPSRPERFVFTPSARFTCSILGY
jgi:hypothetical protein